MGLMKRLLVVLLAFGVLAAAPARAALNVFACEPEWAALAQELGGERVTTFSATTALQDVHYIEARPSLIARLRSADLLVCTGADLEAGWLPMLLRQAGNARVQPGTAGHFEAAAQVTLLDVPAALDRALGDIHPAGNPHVHTDPRRVARIAERLAERLAALDPANATHYRARHAAFARRWAAALADWSARAAPLRGARAVTHHRDWVYLFDWLGLEPAGTLEPKPGIPATAAHLATLKSELARAPARLVIRTPYQDPRPGEWLAREAGVRVVVLPYTIGGSKEAADLFGLFDDTINRLLAGLR
jgi:zinc/manganese transport system substrate-binding protein